MATRLPPETIKRVEKLVDTLFDDLKARYIGTNLVDKRIVTKFVRELSLPGIYEEALSLEGGLPEKETLESILRTAANYVDSQKANAKAKIVRSILAFLTKNKVEANERPDLLMNKLQAELVETWGTVTSNVERIVATEAQSAKSVGVLDGIVRGNAVAGVEDPVVVFIIVRDGKACGECVRLHLLGDDITPRAWYLSEISHDYHKKGEPTPSIMGLHPHCRCAMTTIMPGWGFDDAGRIKWIRPGYLVIEDQRGINPDDQPSVEKSEAPFEYTLHGCTEHQEPLSKSTWNTSDVLQALAPFGWGLDNKEGGKHIRLTNRLFTPPRPQVYSRSYAKKMPIENIENMGKDIGLIFEPAQGGYRINPNHPYAEHYRKVGLLKDTEEIRSWSPTIEGWKHIPIGSVQSMIDPLTLQSSWMLPKIQADLASNKPIPYIEAIFEGDQFIVSSGEEQLAAAKALGMTHVPIKIPE